MPASLSNWVGAYWGCVMGVFQPGLMPQGRKLNLCLQRCLKHLGHCTLLHTQAAERLSLLGTAATASGTPIPMQPRASLCSPPPSTPPRVQHPNPSQPCP